jgi:hypothetical protein
MFDSIKMVPAMEGNISKCHPEKAQRATTFFEGTF